MGYLILFFLLLIWGTGSYSISRFGLKAGSIGIATMIYFVLIASYVIGLLHNIGLYNTSRFSVGILLTYLLVATMICFYLVLLSFITGWLIPVWKSSINRNGVQDSDARVNSEKMMIDF
tara:strand:- start:83077 stop:83433 length:357 start_codon:yes stop_codon:yes gene_type:complete